MCEKSFRRNKEGIDKCTLPRGSTFIRIFTNGQINRKQITFNIKVPQGANISGDAGHIQ